MGAILAVTLTLTQALNLILILSLRLSLTTGGGDGGVSGRRDGDEDAVVYDRSSDKATATAREWYARKAAAVPKKRGPPPMMSAASGAAAADGRVVLEPDYRLAGALAGARGRKHRDATATHDKL